MADGDVILTRDKGTGKVHKRVVLGDGLATLEADNLDQSGAYTVLGPFSELESFALVPGELCRHCFPRFAEGTVAESVATSG
jgi:hypothetical protein